MPLHEWNDRMGWDGTHLSWLIELLRWVKPRLPEGYRAFVGTPPTVGIGAPLERPDVGVRQWREPVSQSGPPNGPPVVMEEMPAPDREVSITTLDTDAALHVKLEGRLIAAVELISPRNKDRPSARAAYLARYFGYLLEGVHLLLIDVHRRPLGFSFADQLAAELQLDRPPCPSPLAAGYRVGEPAATGGRLLALWERPLTPGQPLPAMPLPLTVEAAVMVDLEGTYMRAAADAYLA
jgi:hypothetical protein